MTLPAAELVTAIESVTRLMKQLSQGTGMSLTAAGVLSTLDRLGPHRLTELAASENVSQPAMTQLISRLGDAGLVERVADDADRRAVQLHITDAGRAQLAYRRRVKTERLEELLSGLDPKHHEALTAAIPAINALTDQAGALS
ncbi:MarR family winged helix-turn-helix transcriptional regulator [Actinosynnema sp. ALI-1.44]|uniref:MarR family winged helix-turn-helix transcriptional regulator n=1 Tax=Actinosynnema sp. ALI-1.44 TaxID=1933779 RepID=UPI00192CF65C|nr:MarR family transcriptional regulator [Actinosynnema sp. ALI-1.44]